MISGFLWFLQRCPIDIRRGYTKYLLYAEIEKSHFYLCELRALCGEISLVVNKSLKLFSYTRGEEKN